MMRSAGRFLAFVATVGVAVAVLASGGQANQPLRVMPLGDSITEGRINTPGVPSYRKTLWDELQADGIDVDLVGSRTGVRGNPATAEADPGGNWDKDHDGHWGWRTDQILNGNSEQPAQGKLSNWLNAHDPDVVVIHLGSNDLFRGQSVNSTLSELTSIVATIRAKNANATIFISTLIPSDREPAWQPLLNSFNSQLPGWVAARTTGASPVILVNGASGYNVAWNYDGVHPGTQGQRHLGRRFADAIAAQFRAATTTTATPTTTTAAPTTTTSTTAAPTTTTAAPTTTTTAPPTTTATTQPPGASSCDEAFGYYLGESDGDIWGFGDAEGTVNAAAVGARLVDLAANPVGCGYWTLAPDGAVTPHGSAGDLGDFSTAAFAAGEAFTSLSATRTGNGLWAFTDRGRVLVLGDAKLHKAGALTDLTSINLAGPILDSVVTPDGRGYYMLGSDGGVFTFGNAVFVGSLPGLGVVLNQPAVGLVPDPDRDGYWIVAADGGVFGFRAPFRGAVPQALPGVLLNQPIVGMVSYGDGYLQVAADGGVFNFSSLKFLGSLGAMPPDTPVVAISPLG